MKSRRRIAFPKAQDYAGSGLRHDRNYSRESRPAEWVLIVNLRCKNPRLLSGLLLIPHKKKCAYWSDTFDIRRSTLFKNESTFRHGTERLANVDAVGYAMRFHTGGNIHSIAPYVIREARVTDNTSRCMATMQPHA